MCNTFYTTIGSGAVQSIFWKQSLDQQYLISFLDLSGERVFVKETGLKKRLMGKQEFLGNEC